MFADDLTLFSLFNEDLQKRRNILEKHCEEWDLELNLSKTQIIMFNKQGAVIRRYKFDYQNQEIEVIDHYTYPGHYTYYTVDVVDQGRHGEIR